MLYGVLQLAQNVSQVPSGPTKRIGLSRLLALYDLEVYTAKKGVVICNPSTVDLMVEGR